VQGSRIAAIAVLVVGAIIVTAVLVTGGQPYRVTARMASATQLVKGNLVQVAGQRVGQIEDIRVTDDSMAEVEFTIEDKSYAPLRRGTRAVIRQLSLSGQANRYIDLQLGDARGQEIPSGGVIPAQDVADAVELDELFDVFDAKTRPEIQRTIKLFGEFSAGKTDEANAALQYLNPALASSSRLFAELTRDRGQLERFITQTSRLTNDLAARDEDLAGLVGNLGETMEALALEKGDLSEAIERLPDFLRRSNSTFVNLRATLDDLDPLVDDAKPVVRDDLPPLLAELRPFARDAAPTVRDLSRTIRTPGRDNDLVELLRRQPAVDAIANKTAERNGAQRPGAFPATRKALEGAVPQIGFLRPYAPDLVGWFDDFSTSGMYDALGGFSRAGLQFNGFTVDPALGALVPVPPEQRKQLLAESVETGRNNRCPGSMERRAPDGTNPYKPTPDYPCDDRQVPIGR
jgi:phospholipid/cholesterol/gamma-HCH transport system substrate-binding protein